MMAHTCNPQFVVGRIATCTASGGFCLMSSMTLGEAILRSCLMPWCFTFCSGKSDYEWSTTLILITQCVAVVGGTIAPASRWFLAIKFRCPKKRNTAKTTEFLVEDYWIRTLYQLKDCPLNLRICGRNGKRLVHNTRNQAVDICIRIQKFMVLLCKLVRLISIFCVSRLMIIYEFCNYCSRGETESNSNAKLDLRDYVLHLEGEEGLTDAMMECERDATGHWIRMGRKKQPRYLVQKLSSCSPGFEGVHKFDSVKVPSLLDSEEPSNCWALPVVTLTSIAVAISNNNDFHSLKELMICVNEGLTYIRVIETNLDIKRDLTNIRKAAEIVWVGVDLHDRWLDVDLHEIRGNSPKDIISQLSHIAKHKFMELRKRDLISCLRDSSSKWPVKILAANAMYRVCETLLLTDNNTSEECSKVMFERISAMIIDIMGACLTNIQHAISIKCHQSNIEEREENVRGAILLLGKTEKILGILSCLQLPSSDPEQWACINEWRALNKDKDLICCNPSRTNSESDQVSDLYLNIVD
ncbi:hypothetical protein ACJIZ3_004139 [Penstemon smallii]|uniref:Uncharacterized protein n=1 Tax=Penstemon smallii TaxID=265156 RepID=A0ABD3S176_9LAMI